MKRYILALLITLCAADSIFCCTSAIVSGKVTATGNTLMWKHRDTDHLNNFVAKVTAKSPDRLDYVALFNEGDSTLAEAWTGLNSAGFAIMNTASYNLVPDTAAYRDKEGCVMSEALNRCRTVDDFGKLLDSLDKPLGVQANFGVIDASGAGAYFETTDHGYTRYDLADEPAGVLYRTNFSCSGDTCTGFGYIREKNARHLLEPYRAAGEISPEVFTEVLSRSFYHSLLDTDMLLADREWIVDQDFIPRHSSSASVVIGRDGSGVPVMWTVVGYPPCSVMLPVTVDSIPAELMADPSTGRSPQCDRAMELKKEVFPITRGSGSRYINLPRLREYNEACRKASLENYSNFRERINAERK